MPPQDSNTSKINTPSTGANVPDDKELREDWNKLSHEDKDRYFSSLPAKDQAEFAWRVGLFDSKLPINVSAPLKSGSIPWMKQKAYALTDWVANQLPTVGGVAGGVVGGAIGEAADVFGGGVPGAIAGSGAGGGMGDAARQFIQHKTGYDQFEDPATKTIGARTLTAAKQAGGQAAGEATGQLLGTWMRPTLERSLAKLYHAGGIGYGDGMGEGRLKTVINDLIAQEKMPGGKSTTVKDLVNLIGETKKDIGARADAALSAPVTVGNHTIPLRDVAPNPTDISNLIKRFATKDPGIVKRASLAGSDPSVTAAKKYMQMVKDRALTFEQHPWTYGELATERMRINRELEDYYSMTPGEKQNFLKENPLFEVDKAIAEHIRNVTYPEMDKAANLPLGTTAKLQTKRGVLIGMDNEVRKTLGTLQDKTVKAQGEGIVDKVSPSMYLTSEGKPGGSFHRIQRLLHTPNGVASADKKVSQAFGHAPLTKVRKGLSSVPGMQIMDLPLRELSNPDYKDPDKKDDGTPDPQSSVAKPRELMEKAKQLNPAANGQVAYTHYAVNPQTQHRIGSHSGQEWFDVETGQQVA